MKDIKQILKEITLENINCYEDEIDNIGHEHPDFPNDSSEEGIQYSFELEIENVGDISDDDIHQIKRKFEEEISKKYIIPSEREFDYEVKDNTMIIFLEYQIINEIDSNYDDDIDDDWDDDKMIKFEEKYLWVILMY